LLGARLRLPAALAPLAVLALLVLAGLGAGVLSGPALRDAVPRLLTAPRPAPATAELLLPGVLLAALVGLFAGIRAARAGGGFFAPVAGAAVLYVAAALLTAGRADPYGLAAALLVGCTVAGWAMLERPAERRGGVLGRAAPGIALGAAVAALVATLLPAGRAFEPRELVTPPPLPLVERNPLPRLAAFAKESDRVLFRHTGGDRRLHLVALAGFDGASWQADANYRPVGAVVPSGGLPEGGRPAEVAADVTIEALDGPWLPASGTPTAVTLPEARVDVDSGSLVFAGGLRAGLRYRVSGRVGTPDRAGLAVAGVPDAARYLAAPRLPFLFAEYVQRIVRGASTPFEQAVLIESAVRERRRLDPTAPAGSSYARLQTFLFGGALIAGAQSGTSEQFATAFAVLARTAKLPTRIMVGFRPGQRGPDGTWVVRGRDALAWPEVYFTGQGWVPFDPTPAARDSTGIGDDAKRQVLDRVGQNQPQPRPTPSRVRPRPVTTPSASAPARAGGAVGAPGGPAPAGLAGVAGSVVLLAVAALALARGLRRGRHRRAGPRGAWSEVLDLLVLLDRRPPRWRTARWVAEDLAAAYPVGDVHPALRLAASADRAAFAPIGSTVDSTWAELHRLRSAVRRGVPWYRRLIWPIDPRPLLRRR
jgi:transglutaminase-like putative cysteine protease